MSHDKPRARKDAQRDAFASGKRVMPKACLRHVMPEACFQHDAAIGFSWLIPEGRGPFAPPVRRESLQTMGFATLPLLPGHVGDMLSA